MYVALAVLRDKMDPKYIIPLEAYESHDDAHQIFCYWPSWIFLWQKTSFSSCFSASRPPRRLIFCVGDPLIKYFISDMDLGFLRKWQKTAFSDVLKYCLTSLITYTVC